MRRGIGWLLWLAVLGTVLTPAAQAATEEDEGRFALGCTSAVLMERATGTVLYAQKEHERLSPASVTKVMTLLLVAEAVESGAVQPDDIVTASPRAASMGGSQIWLKEGETMTVSEMTKCVAVVSANDCAVALAEHLCGSETAFTEAMNRRASELGLADTHFTNCTGLFEDPDHYTSAYDIAVMARELLGHAFIRPFTTIWTDTIRNGAFGLTNTNKLVRYYPGCTGLKTGYTSTAMFCLAASAEREGTEFIAVVLHGETSQKRFDAARTLLDYAFAHYALLTPPLPELPEVKVRLGEAETVTLAAGQTPPVLAEKSALRDRDVSLSLPEEVAAPVRKGDVLGTLTVTAGGETLLEVPLLAAEDVPVRSLLHIWRELLGALCGRTVSL